jgi:transposase
MELKVTNKAFAIDISQSKLTAAKGELVVKQEKSAVYVKEVKEFNYDNEGIEELIKFLGEYKEGIIEATGVYYFHLYERLTEKGYKVTVINPLHLTREKDRQTRRTKVTSSTHDRSNQGIIHTNRRNNGAKRTNEI